MAQKLADAPPLDVEFHNDYYLDFQEIVQKYGYEYECHSVRTEDGYLLTMQRMKGKNAKENAPTVLLQHGMVNSADIWVMAQEKSIAFQLAEQGYDVWFGNNRGSKYSRRHESLNADTDDKFWNFSYVEMGKFDFPA